MTKDTTRRDFLTGSLAAAIPFVMPRLAARALARDKPETAPGKLAASQDGRQISVRLGNTLVAGYRAEPSQKYPYVYPFAGPLSGVSLTTETSEPYPHHQSIFFACDRVNGGNYWQGPVGLGQIVSKGPKLGHVTERTAEVFDECEWHKPGQAAVMTDTRRIILRVVDGPMRWIDFEIRWTAVTDITVEKTNHSLFAVRAAPDLIPKAGGKLENSLGKIGEKATFGQPADWCSYYNKRAGVPGDGTEGIALFYHPANPWKNCPWFTRDYGFISPSPFNFMDKPWRLGAGKSVDLRYRVVAYAGTPKTADLASIYKAWLRE
jgi:hypothetical protein